MDKLTNWIEVHVNPLSEKLNKNTWLHGLQDSFFTCMPLILVGAFGSIITSLKTYITFLPDLSQVNTFTLGMLGFLVAFVFPYKVLERKKIDNLKVIAGLTSLLLYIICVKPTFGDTTTIDFGRFGGGGVLISIALGVITVLVLQFYAKSKFYENNTPLPDYVYTWFTSMIPEFILVIACWGLVYGLNIDLFASIQNLFMPLVDFGQTYFGYLLIWSIPGILYAFGITPWVLVPVQLLCVFSAMSGNAELIAAGKSAAYINSVESMGFIIGGAGLTFMLNLFMCFSKSSKLKTFGRISILPSVFSINEPLVYGTPIALNPVLMIPMIINALVAPTIIYFSQSLGLIKVFYTEAAMATTNMPIGLKQFMIGGTDGLILLAILVVATGIIWFPFYKAYEKQCIAEEKEDN